jgi:hypothetical protein
MPIKNIGTKLPKKTIVNVEKKFKNQKQIFHLHNKCSEQRHWLLDFHHIDPNKKDFQLSQGERYGWEKVQKEIDKCIVLCSNRDFHHQEKTKGMKIEDYLVWNHERDYLPLVLENYEDAKTTNI